uniref:Ketoreductase domain-containing protein n=1 Tax=Oryza nivara TaxID=4536 RepID=A0A0E0I5B7_ORYNI
MLKWTILSINSSYATADRSSRCVAVITGGASGIGEATAKEFIRNGAKVIIADVQDDLGHTVAAELGPDAAYTRCDVTDEAQIAAAVDLADVQDDLGHTVAAELGPGSAYTRCDVTDEAQIAATVDLAVARHGHLDILYNNAGITSSSVGHLASLDLADFDRVMAVNARAVLAGIKHAARVMAPRRTGSILCTASNVSKAAVIGVVRSAAGELARHGVRLNAISPLGIATPLAMRGFGDMLAWADAERVRRLIEEDMNELEGATLEAEDIARAAVYLASDEAKYVTGHNLVVDGGFTVGKRLNSVYSEEPGSEPNFTMMSVAANKILRGRSSGVRPMFSSGLADRLFSSSASSSKRLEGKVAVITGAVGGIGEATAKEFVRNGAKVILADIQDDLGRAMAAELGADAASYTHCDVTVEADVAAAVDLAVARHGRLDVVYSNAGIAGAAAPPTLSALDLDDYDRVMAVNARSMVACLKHAARVMSPRRAGCILCTASSTALIGDLAAPAYCISKAAVVGMVRTVARQLARDGVRVNAISPHIIPTALVTRVISETFPAATAEEVRRMVTRDMQELEGASLEVEDVARAAVFLASDEAKFVTGHNLVVDGGFTYLTSSSLPRHLDSRAWNRSISEHESMTPVAYSLRMINAAGQLLLRGRNRGVRPMFSSGLADRFFSSSASSSRKLDGKVAVITGAASGIGEATAKEFIRNGAKVIIADIQDDLGRAVAGELGADAASYTHCDVTVEADVAAAVDLAVARHGRLDVVYSNAGIAGAAAPPTLAALDLDDYDRVMAVNARSMVACLKHASRVMAPRRAGCILCTASSTAVLGNIGPLAYSMSKAAVVGMVRTVARQLARDGVRVNAISPHAVPTPMAIGLFSETFPAATAEEVRRMVTRDMHELEGASLEVDDIARAAVFLASDEAKFITGHNLVVDGGFTGEEQRCSSDVLFRLRRSLLLLVGLDGKVAVITGAASGIGEATAKEFVRNGAKVILADIQDDLGRAVAGELGADAASYTHCDVTVEADVAAAVDLATVARQLARDGVRVNAISPHAIPTAMALGIIAETFPAATAEEVRRMVTREMQELEGASLEVEDVARAAVFLASDEAKFITGHNLVVDGGFTVGKTSTRPPRSISRSKPSMKTSRCFVPSPKPRLWNKGKSIAAQVFFSSSSRSRKLDGKVAVITGAASGIGEATAKEFVRNGAKVIIADIKDDLGRAVAGELGADAASYTHCDVTVEKDVASAVDLAVARHGRLDVVYSNAAIAGGAPPATLAALDLDEYDRVMAVNARSMLACVKHAARVMAPRRAGCILCTASTAAVLGGMAAPAYSMSKAAVVGMVRTVARQLARDGVRVNAISPHAVPTPMAIGLFSETFPAATAEEEVRRMVTREMQELEGASLEVEDVARAAVFLASDEAKFITGHNLVVDGGFTKLLLDRKINI